MVKRQDKKGAITLEVIVGIIVIAGGVLYLFGNPALGAITTTLGLLIELIVRYFKW